MDPESLSRALGVDVNANILMAGDSTGYCKPNQDKLNLDGKGAKSRSFHYDLQWKYQNHKNKGSYTIEDRQKPGSTLSDIIASLPRGEDADAYDFLLDICNLNVPSGHKYTRY